MTLISESALDVQLRARLEALAAPLNAFDLARDQLQVDIAAMQAQLLSYGIAYAYTRAQIDTLLAGKTTPADVATLIADRAAKATTITAAGLATGGGDLSSNRTITVPKATVLQAKEGTLDNVALTPATAKEAILYRSRGLRRIVTFNTSSTYIPDPDARYAEIWIRGGRLSDTDDVTTWPPKTALFFVELFSTLEYPVMIGSGGTRVSPTAGDKEDARTIIRSWSSDMTDGSLYYPDGDAFTKINGNNGAVIIKEY